MYNMFMKSLFALSLFFCFQSLFSLDPLDYIQSEPVLYLGMQPRDAWEAAGLPESIGTTRDGEGPVIPLTSHLRGGLSLYWFNNRVWQISLQPPWDRSFWGLKLGLDSASVKEVLGRPYLESENWMLYKLPDVGFPVEGRFFFDEEGRLEEFYFYRSDY